MNLINLFELQQNLDVRIRKEQGLEHESLLSQKTLALQVEIAELANESRCYKFWNSTNISNNKSILESLVNSLYFLLSLGIEKNFNDINTIQYRENKSNITSQFLNLYVDINDFIVCSSKDHYITLFEDFLSITLNFGYSPNTIIKEYTSTYISGHYLGEKQYL
ncbi:dUTP diphosphatase [Clostridium tyrobutyricum]|uniref:dUTP diphosphatase n=1 Tax=Clostridium tyrobutyricum TaxID=1519 RepID=UPI0011C777B5|nr:dUTP diphosphatase [Clostridium tyrobutyricum]